jgi:hypothetical protein
VTVQCEALYEVGRCREPAASHVQTGCRHEHINEFDWCREHATPENVWATAICRNCWEQQGIETEIAVRILGDTHSTTKGAVA